MKKIIIVLLFALSYHSYSQTVYYTTDGKNRILQVELDTVSKTLKKKYTKILEKEMFVNIKIGKTITEKDSIIHSITFDITDKKEEDNFTTDLLSDFKNKKLPNFNLKTLLGEHFTSEKLKGKPTMINFWFTTCPPCIAEMPVLNKIAAKYKNEINFIAITYETQSNVQQFLIKNSFEFKHLVDAQEFTNRLGVQTYPMNLFLDDQGILKYVKNGIPYETYKNDELIIGDGNEIIKILELLKKKE